MLHHREEANQQCANTIGVKGVYRSFMDMRWHKTEAIPLTYLAKKGIQFNFFLSVCTSFKCTFAKKNTFCELLNGIHLGEALRFIAGS